METEEYRKVVVTINVIAPSLDPYRHQKKWQKTKRQTDPEYRKHCNEKQKERNHRPREDQPTRLEVVCQKAKERYDTDPEYRARRLAANRASYQRRKAARGGEA